MSAAAQCCLNRSHWTWRVSFWIDITRNKCRLELDGPSFCKILQHLALYVPLVSRSGSWHALPKAPASDTGVRKTEETDGSVQADDAHTFAIKEQHRQKISSSAVVTSQHRASWESGGIGSQSHLVFGFHCRTYHSCLMAFLPDADADADAKQCSLLVTKDVGYEHDKSNAPSLLPIYLRRNAKSRLLMEILHPAFCMCLARVL
eukprot:IDg18354t1